LLLIRCQNTAQLTAVGWCLDMQSHHAIKPENAWMSCGGQLPIQRDSAALKGAIRPRE
jgi:hypothetical protein